MPLWRHPVDSREDRDLTGTLCPEANAGGKIYVSAQKKALYANIHASFVQVKALQL